jgi:hypothetical protein
MTKHKRILATLLVSALALVIPAIAGQAAAQDVTQGYDAAESLQNGMLVRLKSGASDTVEGLTQEHETSMLGVVVASSESPVSLSDPNKPQVFVASFGKYAVLVSTQNGSIKAGDLLTISAIKGVAMKADNRHQVIIGKALQGFSEGANAESHTAIAGTQIALGRVPVDIAISHNPFYAGDSIAGVPTFLARAAQVVTNKPITALRLYAGLGILLLTLSVAGFILYAGVRTAVSSVGRNPLAKGAIWRSMISVTLVSLIVVSIGLVAVYLLLKI